jgi:hypothetical protein
MSHLKRNEVVAIENQSGHYHVDCYDGNLDEIEFNNVLTENDMNDEDWYFCNICNKRI